MSQCIDKSNASNMTLLLTGATGNVGSLVVERLGARGHRPRIFVRDAGRARTRYGDRVDIYAGDLSDASTLAPALPGVDALLLINTGYDLAARDQAAASAAKAAGVKHLVKLSSIDAREQNVGTGVWHARGEAAIRATGIPFTFVQPSGFMVNALSWAGPIKAEGKVYSSTADGRIPFIHSVDIADVVVQALTTRQYLGASLPITGPEALSYPEMTARSALPSEGPSGSSRSRMKKPGYSRSRGGRRSRWSKRAFLFFERFAKGASRK